MLFKSSGEIKIMQESGKILSNILDQICKIIQPGITTGELEKLACKLIDRAGGKPSFKGYKMHNNKIFPTAICTSINNEVVHAPSLPSRELKLGDIVDIDIGFQIPNIGCRMSNVGCRKSDVENSLQSNQKQIYPQSELYLDMSRTVGVGKINKQARKLINVTKQSLDLAIQQVKPGNSLNNIGETIQNFIESHGFSVVRELVGHGVGHKVHEDPKIPNYKISQDDKSLKNIILQPGMVLAIEPMVNIGNWRIKIAKDGFTALTADNSLSAHFEHTVAVVDDGYLLLT